MYNYLKNINSPLDVKKLSINELKELATESREAIINRVSALGGHFGSNLGMVEATIALHYVFNSPVDKLVFDVSHQCYCHKLLTGRANAFIYDSMLDSISGFSSTDESEHDIFNIGHTSTSISLACGLAKARDVKGGKEKIIAVIGDGSLSGGQAFEGLNFASELGSGLIIVVNDNGMSIAENYGGIYENLKVLRETNGTANHNIFKALNLEYMYVDDGNDIEKLISAFNEAKCLNRPVVIHICTVKGKGYSPAENEKEKYHSYGPFDKKTGELTVMPESETYINIARDFAINKASCDSDFVAIVAGAPSSIGFDAEIRRNLGKQYVDVGIAEEHAVAFASAIAKNGATPLFTTYSSFIQRTYDQVSQDLCLNKSPATILVSNASIYGMKDKTHLGIFDIPLLSAIPELVYLAPTCAEELTAMLSWATTQKNHPVAIKMPAGPVYHYDNVDSDYSEINKYKVVKSGDTVAVLALGAFFERGSELCQLLSKKGINATLVNPRFASGIDAELLCSLVKSHNTFVTLEDGILEGGFGHRVASFLGKFGVKVLNYGLKKEFIDRYDVDKVLLENRLMPEQILEDIL